MNKSDILTKAILKRLETVIDPETGANVLRMRLVEDLHVNEHGKVTYTFRPSSPLCPIAVPLALSIVDAIKEVPGVTEQDLTVVGYIYAEHLNETLKSVLSESSEEEK
ncbi:MAG: iron-sulfur cluster assembly protein [Anaerolineaceae bacterium]|nr:iron-sulfur cluster assembly protein [Anaerolineaceae bacterium]